MDGGAKAVLCSALMNRSLRYMRTCPEAFRDRPDIPVLVGGAPVTAEFADEIGAAGYAADAPGAVRLLEKILNPDALHAEGRSAAGHAEPFTGKA